MRWSISAALASLVALFTLSDARNVNVRGKRSEADLIGNYGLQACPSDNPVVRNTKGALLDAEVNLLRSRRQSVQRALQSFFNRVTIDDFDAASYVGNPSSNSLVPTVGLAFSGGGGYRSFLTSAGAWSAFDNMNPFAMREDGLGGLLQAATYVSGQDSSAWLLASIYMNNFTTVQDLQSRVAKDSSLWDFSRTVLQGPPPAKGQSESSATDSYLDDIKQKVKARTDSNWNTSLPDVWGLGLSYQIIDDVHGGTKLRWSSLTDADGFSSGNQPFPLMHMNVRYPPDGEVYTDTEDPNDATSPTFVEVNGWELASYASTLSAGVPMKDLGTAFTNGEPTSNIYCQIDSAAYILALASQDMVKGIIDTPNAIPAGSQKSNWYDVTGAISSNSSVSFLGANPFYGYTAFLNSSSDSSPFDTTQSLQFASAGFTNEEHIPLHPLLVPERQVDVIFAVDSSSDTSNHWPNGTSLSRSYNRLKQQGPTYGGFSMPNIPDPGVFISSGFNSAPGFFGCSDSGKPGEVAPLIVYIPNAPYSYLANITSTTLEIDNDMRNEIITNGYNAATRGNGSDPRIGSEPAWPKCVGCAILLRSLQRSNTKIPAVCNTCFQTYCWDGKDTSGGTPKYNPKMILPKNGTQLKPGAIGVDGDFQSKDGRNSGSKKSSPTSTSLMGTLIGLVIPASLAHFGL